MKISIHEVLEMRGFIKKNGCILSLQIYEILSSKTK